MKLLAYYAPDSTDVARLYEPTTGYRVESVQMTIANTSGSSATYRVFLDCDGDQGDDTGTALAYDLTVAGDDSAKIDAGWCIPAGGRLSVRSGTADALTFWLFGEEVPDA